MLDPVIDLSNVSAEVSIEIAAPPERVWDLVTDLSRTPTWNRETESTVWLEPHDAAVVGAVFRGTNVMGGQRWSVDCHVIEATRPTTFEWTVLDPSHPSTTWWYRLAPSADGTRLDHGFQHGPGPSGIRHRAEQDPANAEAMIAIRTEMLADNMRHTLGAIKAVAERP
jgi:uncharacterized protein YndB with AHSA1/START domain